MKFLQSFPEHAIISTSWGEPRIEGFLKRQKKGAIFGYSNAFTLQEIVAYARGLNMSVGTLPLSNPYRKRYGEYVLRVTKPYCDKVVPVSVSFENISYMTRMLSPGNRACKGDKCSSTISKGDEFLEISELVELPSGRKCYKKTSLCNACAATLVKSKVRQLLRVSCLSNKKVESTIKAIDKL